MIRAAVAWFLVAGLVLCIPLAIAVQAATRNSAAGIAFGWIWFDVVIFALLVLRGSPTPGHARPGPPRHQQRVDR